MIDIICVLVQYCYQHLNVNGTAIMPRYPDKIREKCNRFVHLFIYLFAG